jgi:HEAT repeat protein
MSDKQPDLFSFRGSSLQQHPAAHAPDTAALDDASLIAEIPDAQMSRCTILVAEAGRRRLAAAVPVLVALCRRFAGFGSERQVPEQVAALQSLAAIGGPAAARAVGEMIEQAIVGGPGLRIAVSAAAQLRSPLPAVLVQSLLGSVDAAIRADACRCARPAPELFPLLTDLLRDASPGVSAAAACALGRMGRPEALAELKSLLRKQPPVEVIDAVCAIADDDCVDLLGKLARTTPSLTTAVTEALEAIALPRATRLLAAL